MFVFCHLLKLFIPNEDLTCENIGINRIYGKCQIQISLFFLAIKLKPHSKAYGQGFLSLATESYLYSAVTKYQNLINGTHHTFDLQLSQATLPLGLGDINVKCLLYYLRLNTQRNDITSVILDVFYLTFNKQYIA